MRQAGRNPEKVKGKGNIVVAEDTQTKEDSTVN